MIKTRSLAFGLGVLMATSGAWAAGFQLNEFGAAAQGRANAGEPAMTDTAAALARNSAVMNSFDKASISIAYHYINPEVDVKGKQMQTGIDAGKKDIAPSASVPSFHYIQPINEWVAVGLSLNSYFGLSTKYGDSYQGSEFANETSIKTYYLTPHVSFKVTDSLSLGLGVSYIYGEGVIKNTASASTQIVAAGAPTPVNIPAGTTLLDLDGDGDAVGYTLGLLWHADEYTRIGFSYRSKVDLKLDGKVQMGALSSKGKLTLNLPDVYELGVAHDFGDRFTAMAGLQKTGWHTFRELKGDIKGVGKTQFKEEKWRDAYRLSVGGEWHVIDMLTLRAGVGYDESPVESEYRSLSIPDANRKWFTLGASTYFAEAGSLDLAVSYLKGGKVDVNETSAIGTKFAGSLSKTDAFIYSVAYNISF